MSSLSPETTYKHYNKPMQTFQDPELCAVLTEGITQKDFKDVTEQDVRGGLRQANWSYNLLQCMITNPEQGTIMLSRYLGRIRAIGTTKRLSVRLLASLVHELELPEFKGKIPPHANEEILAVTSPIVKKITNRINEIKKRKLNFDEIFPLQQNQALHALLASKGGEFSPRKCDKLIFEVKDSLQRNQLLDQYLGGLKQHPENQLAKTLVNHLTSHLKESKLPYTAPLDEEIQQRCNTVIAEFQQACK